MLEKNEVIASIIKKYGTPLYIYDGDIALERSEQIRKAFLDFDILYSLKSNPHPIIARILSINCHGAEVASLHELGVALNNGFKPENITYGGPGKPLDEFSKAIEKSVDCIDLESEREIKIMEELCNAINFRSHTTLRINTSHKPSNAGEYMAGGPSVFGIDEEIALNIMKKYRISLSGIHAHVASQVLDAGSLVEHYTRTSELALSMSRELGFDLQIINFGGGIGIPYSNETLPIDIHELGRSSYNSINQVFSKTAERPKLQLEIGRFLVAECGTYYTKIVDVKESRGQNYIVTDCGINGFARPAMHWAESHLCNIVSKENVVPSDIYTITGRSCLPTDVLCENAKLPNPQPGDVLAFYNAGAYGFTMSMLFWSGRPLPKEIVVWDGSVHEISHRGVVEL